jgi:hypothetical protein
VRRPPASTPTQTWPKFMPGIGRVGRVGPDASYHWGGRRRRAGPFRSVRMGANSMRQPAGDALRTQTFRHKPLRTTFLKTFLKVATGKLVWELATLVFLFQ